MFGFKVSAALTLVPFVSLSKSKGITSFIVLSLHFHA